MLRFSRRRSSCLSRRWEPWNKELPSSASDLERLGSKEDA